MNTQPDLPEKPAGDPLPPVEAPSAGFILQLFVIPMVIVTIIVLVWLMFSWLAHMGSNPQDLVRDLKRLNDASWQRALTLADLLRNPDYDFVRDDAEMATELAGVLDAQVEAASLDDQPIKLRMFLCRALGEFRVPEVFPSLLNAATEERDPREIDVRRAALEAIAVYAQSNDIEAMRSKEDLMQVLNKAAAERSENADEAAARNELRSTAAYVLGVVGGADALDRLDVMQADSYTNVRYNAALGLARHGDERARTVLLEMLDPANEDSAADEESDYERESKRLQVLKNAIEGCDQLAEKNTTADLAELQDALENVVDSDLALFSSKARRGLRINAKETLITLQERQ